MVRYCFRGCYVWWCHFRHVTSVTWIANTSTAKSPRGLTCRSTRTSRMRAAPGSGPPVSLFVRPHLASAAAAFWCLRSNVGSAPFQARASSLPANVAVARRHSRCGWRIPVRAGIAPHPSPSLHGQRRGVIVPVMLLGQHSVFLPCVRPNPALNRTPRVRGFARAAGSRLACIR